MAVASEWDEPGLGLLEERMGKEDEVVGRIVSAGGFGFFDEDEWICNRCKKLGRLGGVVFGVVDGPSDA